MLWLLDDDFRGEFLRTEEAGKTNCWTACLGCTTVAQWVECGLRRKIELCVAQPRKHRPIQTGPVGHNREE